MARGSYPWTSGNYVANVRRGRAGYIQRRPKSMKYARGKRSKQIYATSRGYSRNKVPNAISNFRKLFVRQTIQLVLPRTDASGTSVHNRARDDVNGIFIEAFKFCVSAQPFSVLGRYGTVKPYHSVGKVSDAGVLYFQVQPEAGHEEYNPDWTSAMARYASFRVASMKVQLQLNPQASTERAESTYGWLNNIESIINVRSAFDAHDTQVMSPEGVFTAAGTNMPSAPSLYQLKRLPYFREQPRAQLSNYRRPIPKKTLFNRRFPVSKAQDTITIAGQGSNQAVRPGAWDHRAMYDPNFANAGAVMASASGPGASDGCFRAGKLFVDIRPGVDTGNTTGANWIAYQAAASIVIGYVTVSYEIWLKNDVDAYIKA